MPAPLARRRGFGHSAAMSTDRDDLPEFASSPCFAHELELGPDGYAVVDAQTARDVSRWRKSKREELIAARLAIPADTRAEMADQIAAQLTRLISPDKSMVISLYWPFRGEPDLRGWMREAFDLGARIALPIVVAKAQPLLFREWTPDGKLERGVWNIPVPADGAELVPNVVISPLVGFDPDNYRLGYGGGFYDRTLAAMTTPREVIGIGYASSALPTIFPQPHDIAMDRIVLGG